MADILNTVLGIINDSTDSTSPVVAATSATNSGTQTAASASDATSATSAPALDTSQTTTATPASLTTTSSTPTTASTTVPTTVLTPSTTDTSAAPLMSASATSVTSATDPTSSHQTSTITSLSIDSTTSSAASAASSSSSANTGTTFFQNKGAVAGVFSTIGILTLIVLVYLITCALRRRRARKLDREMDELSFVPSGSLPNKDDADLPRHLGGSIDLSAQSHGTYTQPPLSPPQSYRDGYGYSRSQAEYKSYSRAGAAGIGAAYSHSQTRAPATTYAPVFMEERGPRLQIVQPQRTQVHLTQTNTASLAPSLSAPVHRAPSPSPKDYMSKYTTAPASPEVGSSPTRPLSEIPLSALPNPHSND
ncbi:hypothetical protein B0H10DRAFT_80485 [Mycena sp. CBHHK59/15]|nr:hypothetical protein B0H10DRAFT_80485 [Mycena sp. CBHHK59/15]